MKENIVSRRTIIKSSVFGMLAVSVPSIIYARGMNGGFFKKPNNEKLFYRYPSIDDEIVSEVVGASHFNLDKVKELVNGRPELARATWDWGFGDWETAIGAASHVGRRDIVDFLMSKGARPDIFTFAMLGAYESVKAMIEAAPGIQSTSGPHGISLLQHAKNGLRPDNLTAENKRKINKLISYLESLGNADVQEKNIEMSDEEKEKYLGDYMYGDGPSDGFSIKLNMRKLIALGKIGTFGGALFKTGDNLFAYNGAPSVQVKFSVENGKVLSLTVHEPDFMLTAKKTG